MIPKFSESELKVVKMLSSSPWSPEIAVYDYPVTAAEGVRAAFDRHPVWQVLGNESQIFTPRIFVDNVCRGMVIENRPFDPVTEGGGFDIFGVEWVYEVEVGGSMEVPGKYLLEDVEDWPEVIKFPDVDSWDWEGSAKENNGTYLRPDVFTKWWIQTGWFERLISFMGFEEAAVAMVDEDVRDSLAELFMRISDVYIDIIDHVDKYYDYIGGFLIHDDWGSAKDTFFDPKYVADLIVPAMRKVTDHIHALGYPAEVHSCGANRKQIPNYIAAGWDAWAPQSDINDTRKYYEEWGDQLLFTVTPEPFDPETTSEEEQRRLAAEYAKKYCNPQKPSMFDLFGGARMLTPAFQEELYKQSRILYSA